MQQYLQTKSFIFPKASAHPLPKVQLPPNAIKAIKGGALEAASRPAQVGGTIVHVLGWREGMAILPGSNLKVRQMSVWPCMSWLGLPLTTIFISINLMTNLSIIRLIQTINLQHQKNVFT